MKRSCKHIKNPTLMQTRRGQPRREYSVVRVVRTPTDCGRPPIFNEFLRGWVAHNCVQNCLSHSIGGHCHAASCAICSKGVKCVVYRIVYNSTASQHIVVELGEIKHKETQGCPWRYLHTKLAPDNLKHHRTSAIVLQAVTCAAAATKHTHIGNSVSLLEAVVCAPTVEYRTECSSTHPRCDQRMQAR